MTVNENRPFEQVSGQCMDCGFEYFTKAGKGTLRTVNAVREEFEMPKISKLKLPTPEWVKFGWEAELKG